MEEPYISLLGPVEREGARLVIRIPLNQGGDELHQVCEDISEIDNEDLVVPIPDWLAQRMTVAEGTLVHVDNRGGKFTMAKALVH